MSTRSFVLSLLPTIEKSMVSKDISRLRAEMTDSTIPAFEAASATLKGWTFKDSHNIEMEKVFSKYVRTRFRGNFVTVIHELMKRSLENLNVLEKQLKEEFGSDIVRSALTYSRAQLIQLVETYSFLNKYSRTLLIHVTSTELHVVAKRNGESTSLTNGQRKWLVDNKRNYIQLLAGVDRTPKELDKILKGIPNIEVGETDDGMAAVVGAGKLDPLQLGVSVRQLNPIYHLRMAWEDWMFHRLEVAKEERQLVEYQLLDLKNQNEGLNDPRIDKAIEYTEERLTTLNFKVNKLEQG